MTSLESLAEALIELDEDRTLEVTRAIVRRGDCTPLAVLNICQQAMRVVGERYQRHEYYLAGLILAGEIFKEVVDLVQPLQPSASEEGPAGTVLLGTVRRDIHDIGKNVFGQALRGFGFQVVDLGVDVPEKRFLDEALRFRPDIVCLSGLVTPAFNTMKATTELIRRHRPDLGYTPPIVLGGGTIDDQVCRFVGADSWSNDAMEGVRICQRILQRAPRD